MEVIILINVHMDGKRAIIDLRQLILDGQHPRFEVFEHVKKQMLERLLKFTHQESLNR